MRVGEYTTFAMLRLRYNRAEDIGKVINRGRVAVLQRLKGEIPWRSSEKELIIDDLIRKGIEKDRSPDVIEKYFGG